MRRRKPPTLAWLAAATVLTTLVGLLIGCTAGDQASVVPVTGKVLLSGEPLRFGTVTFQPSHGQPGHGEIGSNGEFVLSTYREGDGAAVGRHKVKITCYASQDPAAKKAERGPQESLGESLISERYTRFDTSGLEVAVLAGGNKPFVFELAREEPAGEKGAEDSGEKIDGAGSPEQRGAQPAAEPAAPEAKPSGPTG